MNTINIPSVFLQPRSLLVNISDLLMHVDILDDPKLLYGNETERFLVILKYYLSIWHYKVSGCKKPINPVLGETYSCVTCTPLKNQYFFVAEQVSRNPRVSAFYMECISLGLNIQGQIQPSYIIN